MTGLGFTSENEVLRSIHRSGVGLRLVHVFKPLAGVGSIERPNFFAVTNQLIEIRSDSPGTERLSSRASSSSTARLYSPSIRCEDRLSRRDAATVRSPLSWQANRVSPLQAAINPTNSRSGLGSHQRQQPKPSGNAQPLRHEA